jgi:molybdopterin molybdotransferase
MIPLDEALRYVLDACPPLGTVELGLDDLVGHVLAEDVVSVEEVPPFANTAVDGYAVVAVDLATASASTPVELVVAGEIAAGAAATVAVRSGAAVRIMTGAPMPDGADAVVMVEHTERVGDDRVRISAPVAPGDAVRSAGDDVRAGDVVARAGTLVTPPLVGVFASVNARRVRVHRRPRVAVLSTGDELVDDGRPLLPGQIRESNKVMLIGVVRRAGLDVVDGGIVPDDEALLESALERAVENCDAVITSGGVSMGDYDVVKAVLGRIAEMRWMQIAMKPAKPFAFGTMRSGDGRVVPIFGLPGNPVSSLVSFELLARPGLAALAGVPDPSERTVVRAVVDEALRRRPDGKVHFLRVETGFRPDGRLHVRPVGRQGSHQLADTALAGGLAIVPDGDGVPTGGEVDVLLLS